jgi:uncharacterized membrane protein YfcA
MNEQKNERSRFAAVLSGGAAGLVNGFFGGGGGMVLIPLLVSICKLPRQKAFATSVAIILPLCILSAGIYFFNGNLDLGSASPYLAGGLVGGLIGGKLYRRLSMRWLRRIFALLILYGAWRSLT